MNHPPRGGVRDMTRSDKPRRAQAIPPHESTRLYLKQITEEVKSTNHETNYNSIRRDISPITFKLSNRNSSKEEKLRIRWKNVRNHTST